MGSNHQVDIIMDTKKRCPAESVIRGVAKKTLELEGVKNNIAINLLFTSNKRIKVLNRQFLGRNEPTDVIAFSAKDNNRHLTGFIGEIAISVDMAESNARRFNIPYEKELFLYIIHGILHLLGYDDRTKNQIRDMQEREGRILKTICGRL